MQTCTANLVVADLRAGLDQGQDNLEILPVHQVCFPKQLQIVHHYSLQCIMLSTLTVHSGTGVPHT